MYQEILVNSGLSAEEAEIYEALLSHGKQTAGQLFKLLPDIKRTLVYKKVGQLVQQGLVQEHHHGKRISFSPLSPERLAATIHEHQQLVTRNVQAFNRILPELSSKYNQSTERPVVTFFEGIDGLQEMYEDVLVSGTKEQLLLRPSKPGVSYQQYHGRWFTAFLKKQKKAGIHIRAITPDDADTNHDPKIDALNNFARTWVRVEDYHSPVEISIYANRVAIKTYGRDIFGVLITDPLIADAFRALFRLAELGGETITVPHDHPVA